MASHPPWSENPGVPFVAFFVLVLGPMFVSCLVGHRLEAGYWPFLLDADHIVDPIETVERFTAVNWDGQNARHGVPAIEGSAATRRHPYGNLARTLILEGRVPTSSEPVSDATLESACALIGQEFPSDVWGSIYVAEGTTSRGERVVAAAAIGEEIENDVRGSWEWSGTGGEQLTRTAYRELPVFTDVGPILSVFLAILGAGAGSLVFCVWTAIMISRQHRDRHRRELA